MAFWNNIFNRFGYYTAEDLHIFDNNLQFKCDSNILEYNPYAWYLKNPIVFIAISERAKAVSSFKFYVEKEDGSKDFNHPILDKINNPNEYQSLKEFVFSLVVKMSIYGTGYLYNNKIAGIRREKADNLVLSNENLIIKTSGDWVFSKIASRKIQPSAKYNNGKEEREIDLNNLFPLFDNSISDKNPLYAESRLKSLQYVVSNLQVNLESKNTLLSNPAGIGFFTSASKDASGAIALLPHEREEAERELSRKNGTKLGQIPFRLLSSPLTYYRTSPKISEFDFSQNAIDDSLVVFNAFDLPKELFSALSEGATFENQREAYKRFMQSGGQHLADIIASAWAECYNYNIKASCSHLPVMQEDEKLRAEVDEKIANTMKNEKEIWDDWLLRNLVTEQQYKEKFLL